MLEIDHLERSIFGKIARSYEEASVSSGHSGRFNLHFAVAPKEVDAFGEFIRLSESGKLKFDVFYFIYSLTLEFAGRLFEQHGSSDFERVLNREMKELLMQMLPTAIRASIACHQAMENKEKAEFCSACLRFITEEKYFMERLANMAFNDALVTIVQEEVRQAVKAGQVH